MVFAKRLREGVRRGRIRCSIRIWTRAHVKVGGRYQMDEGQIVVDSIVPMRIAELTHDLARESGFDNVKDLLATARHGRGNKVYLVRFHYLRPGAWDVPQGGRDAHEDRGATLLERIRRSTPVALPGRAKSGLTARWSRRRED